MTPNPHPPSHPAHLKSPAAPTAKTPKVPLCSPVALNTSHLDGSSYLIHIPQDARVQIYSLTSDSYHQYWRSQTFDFENFNPDLETLSGTEEMQKHLGEKLQEKRQIDFQFSKMFDPSQKGNIRKVNILILKI